jgi:hypothetical protein
VIVAARVANTFQLDPIAVLSLPRSDWLILLAAHDVISIDAQRAAKAAQSGL